MTTTNMEIDPPATTASTNECIEFHPLAIMHMSDQYTRITSGGSPLPDNSPVVGLLFGTTPNDEEEEEKWQVLDADDIATEVSESTQQQISLHQAVFPQHSVVGWYRVTSSDTEPVAEDLQTTQKLQQHFSTLSSTTMTNTTNKPFVFCFCQVKNTTTAGYDHENDDDAIIQDSNDTSNDNNDSMIPENDDSLPITLYQVADDVLLAIDDWKLETSETEKIAVETVLREKPRQESGFLSAVNSMESAVQKMKDRLTILIQFLEDTDHGKLPYQPRLMRQVQSVVCHMALLTANEAPPNGVEDWLLHMAVAAKTVKAVQGYTEKVKLVQEHRAARRF